MLIKVIIVVLFVLILVSLVSGYIFFIKDQGDKNSRRVLHALGTRVTLAILLMVTIIYGVYTNQLGSTAPWDKKLHQTMTTP